MAPLIRNGCLDVFEFAMQLRRDGETGRVPPGTQDNENLVHVVQNLGGADKELTERRAEIARPGQPARLGKDLGADVCLSRQFGMNADADFGAGGLEEVCHCGKRMDLAIVPGVRCAHDGPVSEYVHIQRARLMLQTDYGPAGAWGADISRTPPANGGRYPACPMHTVVRSGAAAWRGGGVVMPL
jgi:hypothetical protein